MKLYLIGEILDFTSQLAAHRPEPFLRGAERLVLTSTRMFVHPANPDPPVAHVDKHGISASLDNCRRRHRLGSSAGDGRGRV